MYRLEIKVCGVSTAYIFQSSTHTHWAFL